MPKRKRPREVEAAPAASEADSETHTASIANTESQEGSSNEQESSAFHGAVQKVLSRELHAPNPVLAKRHTASLKASSADQKEKREAQKDIQTRKQRRRQNLVKPSVLQQGHERKLRRVATRGVVALFNAIRKHQKTASLTEEEEDKLAFHKNKMEEQKSGFLDLLKSTERTLEEGNKQSSAKKSKKSAKKGKQDEGENKQWSVFKDDFMMGARAKDWNKPESDSDEEDGWNFSSGALDGDNDDENL
eukprot:gb/GECG01006975.1/.p1 GENE.gb/GECG01006975.1/~~gb/GECG01006975.1/.p1  ORF type:complete len:247 (+),score=51.48 gb/GECG01006975.1/:1-741(+)